MNAERLKEIREAYEAGHDAPEWVPFLLAHIEKLEAVVEEARIRCNDAVPQWAPGLRAALKELDK